MGNVIDLTRALQAALLRHPIPEIYKRAIQAGVITKEAVARRKAEILPLMPMFRRDQTSTILETPGRLTKAHRRGNVKPVLISPRRRPLYMHSAARRRVEEQKLAA